MHLRTESAFYFLIILQTYFFTCTCRLDLLEDNEDESKVKNRMLTQTMRNNLGISSFNPQSITMLEHKKNLKRLKSPYVKDPCRKFPNGHLYSDAQTCHGYFRCLNRRSVWGTCPDGFALNAIKQRCAPDRTCRQALGSLHPCFAGTTVPFPGQPRMFYLLDGQDDAIPMICPEGLWYNPRICSCDWLIAGKGVQKSCLPLFHFGYNGDFLEEYNKVPQAANAAVSIYKNSALFSKGGRIVIWMMNDIDMDTPWAMCFEFMTYIQKGEVALLSNDWKKNQFTYKITYLPSESIVKAYFRLNDKTVVKLIVFGVKPTMPHFLRIARYGHMITMRVDKMPAATVKTDAAVASTNSPMVVGSSSGCVGFIGYFDELKFFRCIPKHFFDDY